MHFRFLYLMVFLLLASSTVDAQRRRKEATSADGTEYSDKFHELFFQGMREYGLNNYEKAEKAFIECLDIVDSEPAVYYQLSKVFWEQGRVKEAIEYAKTAFELAPQNEDIFRHYLGYLEAKNLFTEAIASTLTYLEGLSTGSDQVTYQKKLAALYVRNREHEEALAVYQVLESTYGFSNSNAYQQYSLQRYLGNYVKAHELLDELIDRNPDDELYYYLKGNLLNSEDDVDNALKYYNSALKAKPDHLKSLIESGQILLDQNTEEAVDRYKRAFESDDASAEKKLNYFEALEKTQIGNDDLLALAGIIQQMHPNNAQANKKVFTMYAKTNQLEKGVPYLEKAVEADKADFSTRMELLIGYYDLGWFDKLKASSERGVEYFPNQPALYLYSAIASMEQGDYDEAIMILKTGRSMIIDNHKMIVDFELTMADIHHRMGNYEASDEVFNHLLEQDQNRATVLNNYAYFLAERGDNLKDAEKMSKEALNLEPENATFIDTYGWVMFSQKKYADAVEWLEKAAKLSPGNGEILEHLGDAHAMNGDITLAVDYWKEAKKSGADSDLLNRKISNKRYYEK